MGEFEQFQVAITDAAQKFILPLWQDEAAMRSALESVEDLLFDGSKPVSRTYSLPRDYAHFWNMFGGFTEIFNSFESLLDAEAYLRSFPFRAARLNRVRYLRFVIEAYLNEVYILQGRLHAYAKRIKRAYQRDSRRTEIETTLRDVTDQVTQALGGISKTRGAHVHQSRFSTKDLDKLVALDLMFKGPALGGPARWNLWYKIEYRRIRREWVEVTRKNNRATLSLLDDYFLAIHAILFDDAGELINAKPPTSG